MGRLKQPQGTTKTALVATRLTAVLASAFRDGCEARGMTPSAYLTYLIAKTPEAAQNDPEASK